MGFREVSVIEVQEALRCWLDVPSMTYQCPEHTTDIVTLRAHDCNGVASRRGVPAQ